MGKWSVILHTKNGGTSTIHSAAGTATHLVFIGLFNSQNPSGRNAVFFNEFESLVLEEGIPLSFRLCDWPWPPRKIVVGTMDLGNGLTYEIVKLLTVDSQRQNSHLANSSQKMNVQTK
jgi:hypothetical protein